MSTDSPDSGRTESPQDERSTERAVVDLVLEATIGERTCRVALFDLSVEGCKVEAAGEPLTVGEVIAFELPGEHRTSGRIVWVQDSYAGVFFDQPLHEALVAHLKFKPASEARELRDRFGRVVPNGNRNTPPD